MRASDVGRWASMIVPALVCLAASAFLFVDYTRPVPVFCDPGGGCDAVKRTAFAHVLGVPTPAFGVAAFMALGILSVLRGARVRMVQAVLASLAAFVSAALLVVQAKVGHFCPYCVVSDVSALVLLVAVWVRQKSAWDVPQKAFFPIASASLFTIAVVLPGALSLVVKPKLPKVVLAELAKTPRGKVMVLDFADFECPWCRLNHQELSPLLEEHKADVHLVRKQVPLMMHPHAMTAALASVCAEKLGKGDAVAEALFSVETTNLTPEGCEKIATSAGLDLEAFRTCVKDPATTARVLSDKDDFKASGGKGLPTVWIGAERIDGSSDRATLGAALERALARK
jgi:uncharacterized membrane protein/predicted DsbA family dithiol-disulfide isomerase